MEKDLLDGTALIPVFSGRPFLVTGATGLIGRALVRRLLDLGARPITLSSRPPPADFPPRVEHRVADLRDATAARRVICGADGLFHLAGRRGSIGLQRTHGATMLHDNVLICFNTLDAARHNGIRGGVYVSTVSIYPPAERYQESDAWAGNPHPGNEFVAWAKRMGEKLVEAQAIEYGLKDWVIVRPVNTFGPHDDFDPNTALVVPALIRRALDRADPLVVWGDGSAVRDFLFVDDLVEGLLRAYAFGRGTSGALLPPAFNLGSGQGHSIREVVDAVRLATGHEGRVHWETDRPAGESRKVADITRAREELGFRPTVSLATAILRTVEWARTVGWAQANRYGH